MIKQLKAIQNIGSFYNFIPKDLLNFNKLNLIYGENGCGKSTFSTIIKSLSVNDSDLLSNKITILEGEELRNPFCELKLDNFTYKFANLTWQKFNSNYKIENILIFDDDFIEKNIFTFNGAEISHAKKQHRIIFGETAVKLNNTKELLNNTKKNDFKPKLEKEKNNFYLKYNISIDEYKNLKLEKTEQVINLELIEINKMIKVSQSNLLNNTSAFKSLHLTNTLNKEKIDESYKVLTANINSQAHLDAKKRVEEFKKQYFHRGASHDNFLKYGFVNVSEENDNICPLCHSSFDSDLLDVYSNYFNQEYEKLIEQLDSIGNDSIEIHSQYKNSLVHLINENQKIYNLWKEYIQKLEEPKIDVLDLIDSFNLVVKNIYEQLEFKKQQTSKIDFFNLNPVEIQSQINNLIETYNNLIIKNSLEIEKYKKTIPTTNLHMINKVKEGLERELILVKQKVNIGIDLKIITDLETQIKTCDTDIKNLDKQIDEELKIISQNFISKINNYLQDENFKLDKIEPKNHTSQTEMHCEIFVNFLNKSLKIYQRNVSMRDVSSVLSTGEKRSLGFAFFMASVETQGYLGKKVLIFDDPITSLDYNRAHTVARKISYFANQTCQTFVITHDKQFFCHLFEEFKAYDGIKDSTKYMKVEKTKLAGSHIFEIYESGKDMKFLTNRTHHYDHYLLQQFSDGYSLDSPENLLRKLFEDLLEYKFPDITKVIRSEGKGKTLFTYDSLVIFLNNGCIKQEDFNSLKGSDGGNSILAFSNSNSHNSPLIRSFTNQEKQNIVKKALEVFRKI